MVSKNELRALLREEGWAYKGSGESWDAYSYLRNTYRGVQRLEKGMSNVPINVWRYKGNNENRDAYSYLRNTLRNTAALQGENEGLLKAVEQMGNVDVEEVRKAAQEGVQKALDSLEADVTLNIDTTEQGA